MQRTSFKRRQHLRAESPRAPARLELLCHPAPAGV